MNFSDFIDLNEAKNTHMTHIEDRVIYGGVNGTREAIFALRDLRDMLGGVKDGSVSVKWDGAPAIFCGTDPSDGKFFVAKKGIFNKNPKIYKTNKDIDDDTSGALNKKTFCIIGPTDATLPRFNSITKIVSDIYDNRREVGLKRCGDNFVQNDSEVKTISVSKVYDTIVKNL